MNTKRFFNPFERKQKGTVSALWIVKSTVIMLLLAGNFYSCSSKIEEATTVEIISEIADIRYSDTCGYLLYKWTGNAGHFHDFIYVPENLPDQYRIDGLRVNVSFCHTGETFDCNNGGSRDIIKILKIERQ